MRINLLHLQGCTLTALHDRLPELRAWSRRNHSRLHHVTVGAYFVCLLHVGLLSAPLVFGGDAARHVGELAGVLSRSISHCPARGLIYIEEMTASSMLLLDHHDGPNLL